MLPKLIVTTTPRSRVVAPSTVETEGWGLYYIGLPETIGSGEGLIIQMPMHPTLKPELFEQLFRNSVF